MLGELGVILLLLGRRHGDGPRRARRGRVAPRCRSRSSASWCRWWAGTSSRPRSVTTATSRSSSAPRSRRRASGITARVFSDLRALATVEARTVLGAAVADDVLGLVILTVVVRLVSEGSVSVADVAAIVARGGRLPRGDRVRWARSFAPGVLPVPRPARQSAGTLVALALAFTLAFAELADAAKLAPIVGAFVAGLALSGSSRQGAHRARARARRPPLHPGVLPRHRHRGAGREVRQPRGARDRRRRCSWWRSWASSSPRSARSARPATSGSSASA